MSILLTKLLLPWMIDCKAHILKVIIEPVILHDPVENKLICPIWEAWDIDRTGVLHHLPEHFKRDTGVSPVVGHVSVDLVSPPVEFLSFILVVCLVRVYRGRELKSLGEFRMQGMSK